MKLATKSSRLRFAAAWLAICFTSACSHFTGPKVLETDYVTGSQTYLRDRLSEIYRKAALVHNGEKVDVLEKSRRFAKVRTSAGAIGWIEQRYLINQDLYDQFQKLDADSKALPAQSSGLVRNETNLHLTPGRDTDHFFQLAPNDKITLLRRQVVPKAPPGGPAPASKPLRTPPSRASQAAPAAIGPHITPPPAPAAATPTALPQSNQPDPILEDWWLVRDARGHAGWILGRTIDLDVPLEILQYAEGRRIVFAGILNSVQDDGLQTQQQQDAASAASADAAESSRSGKSGKAGHKEHQHSTISITPPTLDKDGRVPQYVVLFTESKDGQPFDFNQIRVFTWNTRHHRYENAYRERDLYGLLPASVGTQVFEKEGTLPIFTCNVAGPDGKPVARKYRMAGVVVSRVLSPEEMAAKEAEKQTKRAAAPQHSSTNTGAKNRKSKSKSGSKAKSKTRKSHRPHAAAPHP